MTIHGCDSPEFPKEVLDIALSYYEALDSAESLTCAIMLRYGDFDGLASKKAFPSSYPDPEAYFAAAAAVDFLRKADFLPTTADPEQAAFEKWLWAEKECAKSNSRLSIFESDLPRVCLSESESRIAEFLDVAKREMLDLIGHAPPSLVEPCFGPGATVSDAASHATVLDKMSSTPTLTPSATRFLPAWMLTGWGRAVLSRGTVCKIVRGDIFFTVPKESLTHRACGKGPSINTPYTLAYGRAMRARLKLRGLDLGEGQDVHRQVACAASKSGEFCTIDLSSASDTVSTTLVKLLLPNRWFSPLNALRSPLTFVPHVGTGKGAWVHLQKFSAMGNGYTFELETAIFASIIRACAVVSGYEDLEFGKDIFVYGDDIIVPTFLSDVVVKALKYFGFTPNPKKTFSDGYFRESCGGDFFGGVAVRPHFLKKEPNEPQDFISLANGIRRVTRQGGLSNRRKRALLTVWFRCLDYIPIEIRRCRGPEWLGDLVIHDDESRWQTRTRSFDHMYIRVYRPARHREVHFEGFGPNVQLAAALYGLYLHGSKIGLKHRYPMDNETPLDGRCVHPRDSVTGYKLGWTSMYRNDWLPANAS
ncbi:MAG: RNA replicase beta chain [Sanya fiers-like virus 37]|nr:MAG: RNA replicase beta chain [Sanya fiers-like virus 37]